MLLKSDRKTREHRNKKRRREIEKIVTQIKQFCDNSDSSETHSMILEFGCGNGFQIPYLQELGQVFSTDIYTSDEIRRLSNHTFCVSDIKNLPYRDGSFDIIFSNHVIEHLPDHESAFRELKRVAAGNCLFVFSLPTNIWLLLSLPSKYLGKISAFLQIVYKRKAKDGIQQSLVNNDNAERLERESMLGNLPSEKDEAITFKKAFLPRGHGIYKQFGRCYRSFRIKAWSNFFRNFGFEILETTPLLLYGPSERPVIPTTAIFERTGICSSVLFVLQLKKEEK